jgi:hypothetical protein
MKEAGLALYGLKGCGRRGNESTRKSRAPSNIGNYRGHIATLILTLTLPREWMAANMEASIALLSPPNLSGFEIYLDLLFPVTYLSQCVSVKLGSGVQWRGRN